MTKKNKYGSNYPVWIILCVTAMFMFCIFAPFDAYFTNKSEFWFSFTQLLPVAAIAFIVSSLLFSFVAWIISRTKIAEHVFCILTFALVFFYIQGNYIPRNYGVLNGVDIDWSQYQGLAIASIVLGIVCVILCVVVLLKYKAHVYIVGKYICLFLLVIQVLTFCTSAVQKELLTKQDKNNSLVVTNKNLFNLSESGQNVVVFLLDTFDKDDMDFLIAQDNEKYAKVFENFTYYPDTVGAYPTTKGALPHILTGVRYENMETYKEYVNRAYVNNELMEALENNNFDLDIYTSDTFLSTEGPAITNVNNGEYILSNYAGFAKGMARLVAFNYMPHQLKKYFVIDTDSFLTYRSSASVEEGVFSEDVQRFYKMMRDNQGFKAVDRSNVFKFYHLAGVHAFYTFDESLTTVEGVEYTSYSEAAGNCTLLKEAFDYMRDIGLYDNCAIIIMADHGHVGYSQNPLFLIKNPKENHQFRISQEKMSYDYLKDIIVSLVNAEEVDEHYIRNKSLPDDYRTFYYYTWDNQWNRDYLPDIFVMRTSDVAWAKESMEYTGVEFLAEDDTHNYNIGTVLSFSKEDMMAVPYCEYGFSHPELGFTWTDGHEARMRFKLEGEYDDLEITINSGVYYQPQRVTFYVNDTLICEEVFDGGNTVSFKVPKECITNDHLLLKMSIPDSVMPRDVDPNNSGDRILGLSIRSMCINSIDAND